MDSSAEQEDASYAYLAGDDVPANYNEALHRPDANSWLEACQDELRSLKETRTYTPVSTDNVGPVNIVGNQWVFALKRSSDGSVERYKARLVAKGFNQAYLIDYDETFTPVVKWASIRILLALGACFDWEIHHMDVKTAFLNGDLEHSIYMEPPVGSAEFGSHDILWKLQRSLYGLKQSSRAWYQKARDEFLKLDFICVTNRDSAGLFRRLPRPFPPNSDIFTRTPTRYQNNARCGN